MRNLISQLFGYIAAINFGFLQKYINKFYINFFKIDMSEFKNYDEYNSLNDLFTRKLLKPRVFSSDEKDFISPSDGLCLEHGKSVDSTALSIKGRNYDIKRLLDMSYKDAEFDYINIYLSPKNYHCYHAPCDMQILSALYIPGDLKSVNQKSLFRFENVYETNERVVLTCKSSSGFRFYLVFVGALNVGKMKFIFDTSIQTNAKYMDKALHEYENVFCKKGEMLGNFELGSTIVVLSESGKMQLQIQIGKEIKFGETIAKFL